MINMALIEQFTDITFARNEKIKQMIWGIVIVICVHKFKK